MGVSFCHCPPINGCNRVRSSPGASCASSSTSCCFPVSSACSIIALRSDSGVTRKRSCPRFPRPDCACHSSHPASCAWRNSVRTWRSLQTAFGQFADGDGLRLSGGRLPQTLILVKTVEQSHINPEQYYLTIHYYFRYISGDTQSPLTVSQSGERNGSSGSI